MTEVSIVLPTYNGSRYIREALESIIIQDYSDWELITVDDCSSDDTLHILQEYAAKDRRIRVIHNEKNKKLPESLNVGFSNATGRYLTWTSDDNIYMQGALRRMKEVLDHNPRVFLVYAGMYDIDTYGNIKGVHPKRDPETNLIHDVVGACFLYRREILDEIGGYDTSLFCAEDYDYWLSIMEKHDFIRIDDMLYLYRYHNKSLTSTKIELIKQQTATVMRKHLNFIVNRLEKRPEELLQMYSVYLYNVGYVNDVVTKTVQEVCPMLRNLQIDVPAGNIVVFGAGRIGRKAAAILGAQVVAFADNSPIKIGCQIDGRPVISFDSMMAQKETILIAAGTLFCYKMIKQLTEYDRTRKYYLWIIIEHFFIR